MQDLFASNRFAFFTLIEGTTEMSVKIVDLGNACYTVRAFHLISLVLSIIY
jgi:hypothetical protein